MRPRTSRCLEFQRTVAQARYVASFPNRIPRSSPERIVLSRRPAPGRTLKGQQGTQPPRNEARWEQNSQTARGNRTRCGFGEGVSWGVALDDLTVLVISEHQVSGQGFTRDRKHGSRQAVRQKCGVGVITCSYSSLESAVWAALLVRIAFVLTGGGNTSLPFVRDRNRSCRKARLWKCVAGLIVRWWRNNYSPSARLCSPPDPGGPSSSRLYLVRLSIPWGVAGAARLPLGHDHGPGQGGLGCAYRF